MRPSTLFVTSMESQPLWIQLLIINQKVSPQTLGLLTIIPLIYQEKTGEVRSRMCNSTIIARQLIIQLRVEEWTVLASLRIALYLMELHGRPRKIFTLIRWGLHTETNSIKTSHSTKIHIFLTLEDLGEESLYTIKNDLSTLFNYNH